MSVNKQAGMSTIGIILTVGIFGFLLVTGFKILPLYTDYLAVEKIVKAVGQDTTVNLKSKHDIWKAINKRLRINNMRNFSQENFVVSRNEKITTITIDYEVRNPYLANMFIGATFHKSIELNR